MNNLPSNLTRHTVFRDNDYSHTLVFPDEYPLPAASEMQMQVRRNGFVVAGVSANIVKNGQRVTFTYTKETLQLIPGFSKQYFVSEGESLLGGELNVIIDVGEQDITESVITVVDEQLTVVVVQGLELVTAQVDLATAAATAAGNSATAAAGSATAASTSATNAADSADDAASHSTSAGNSATAASNSAAVANSAKIATEAARDDTIAAINGKANYKEVNLISDLTFPLSVGIVIVKQDTTFGGPPQVQAYYSDGVATNVNDLWMLPTSKRSTVI